MTRLRSFLRATVLPRSTILRLRILEPVTAVLGNVTEIGAKDIAIGTTYRKQTLMEMQVTLTIVKTDAMTRGILMSMNIMENQDGQGQSDWRIVSLWKLWRVSKSIGRVISV